MTAYYALESLIHGAWETHETLTADAEGRIAFSGFKGGYELKTDSGRASLTLDSDVNATITLA